MPIRRLPNGLRHTYPQAGRDPPEQVDAINRNRWTRSTGIGGRNQSEQVDAIDRCAQCLEELRNIGARRAYCRRKSHDVHEGQCHSQTLREEPPRLWTDTFFLA